MTLSPPASSFFFFFNDTATTEIYTLSLHDALPIFRVAEPSVNSAHDVLYPGDPSLALELQKVPLVDRKSTRLNSSHQIISYAVFCLKKKKHSKRSPQSVRERVSSIFAPQPVKMDR